MNIKDEALADHIGDANKMVEQSTCKQNLQVWVISNGKGRGQFSWEPQDERYWTRMEPAQQQEPLAYDKTEINCFAQDLYDQKMREGKRGHYESMFHVIHQCIKKFSPPASKPWVKLTDEDIWEVYKQTDSMQYMAFSREIEAKLKEKNNG